MCNSLKIFLLAMSLFVSMVSFCQNKQLDSLKKIYLQEKDDSSKAAHLTMFAQRMMGVAQNSGNWDEAIQWAHKALNLSKKVNYDFGIGRSYWILGTCWMQKGNFPEAIKYHTEAVNLSFKNGRIPLRQASFHYIANCYMYLGNYKEALKYYLLSFEAAKQLPNPIMGERLHMTIADVYLKLNNYNEAFRWMIQVKDNPEVFYEGEIPMKMADIHLAMKNNDEALKSLRQAIEALAIRLKRTPEINYKGVLGPWLVECGDAYLKIALLTSGDERREAYQQALAYLKKGVPLMEEGTAGKDALMNAYLLLKQAGEAVQEYETAVTYTNKYMHLKDSIYSKQNYLKLAQLQTEFETEKATLAMQAQREKEQMQEAAFREKLLADQRLQQERFLLKQQLGYERELGEQQLKQQQAIAEEKAKNEKQLVAGKAKQEKMKAERERLNNLLLFGSAAITVISLLVFLLIRQRNLKRKAMEKAETIHKMAELEMQSLRAQLNPHFMFNSLNSIQELILMEENHKSHVYLSRFSKLLRMLLENAEKPFISLEKEMEFLHLYLGLESLRVPDLEYSISVHPSINTADTMVPNMLLQPYIENAIWHGLSHKPFDKKLSVSIVPEEGFINCQIQDNGIGRKKAAELKSLYRKNHNSRGMELLNKRLKLLNEEFRTDINVTIADVLNNNEVAGTSVSIRLPVQIAIQTLRLV